jgi:Spy/CpxP family protein refolding chaperone
MTTSKNRTLIFIITVLLITNIAVLGYFLWFKKRPTTQGASGDKPRNERGIEDPLRDSVGFTEDQLSQYRQMRDDQWKAIKPMMEDMRKTKDSLFRMVANENANDSTINSIADQIARKQRDMDLRMFNYFKKIREVCTPDQRPKYDSVIQRMMRRMGKPHKDQDKKDEK